MLESGEIERITTEVAKAGLGSRNVLRTFNESFVSSRGEEAIRVTIVVPAGTVRSLDGGSFLNVLVDLNQRIASAGDERLIVVSYATDEELADDVDPES